MRLDSRTLFAFAALLAAAPSPAQQPNFRDFDTYVARAVRDWRVPGLAIAVVKDDSVVFIKGYGVRELGRFDAVGVHTRFGVMSTTKAFTAMLVAMQADSGRLRLDDPVVAYVPNFLLADPLASRELTVRDLLTHRAGFGDPYYLWSDTIAYSEMVRRLRLVPRRTSLRAHFAYNNVMYAIAGEIAGRASSTTWQTLMRRRIYEPLGMTDSYADAREMLAARITDVTSPHGIVDDTVRVLPAPPQLVDPIAPAGAMFSSATDMAKWIRFLLDSNTVAGRRGISARSYAELFTPQQVVGSDEFYPTARLTRPRFTAYGLGWFLEDYRGQFVAFHTGSIEGRSAIVGLMPDTRLGVVVLTNLDHSELRHALMYTVFDAYLGPDPRGAHDWSAEMRTMYTALADSAQTRQKAREAKRVLGTKPSLVLERYAGTYGDSLFGLATVRVTPAGTLALTAGGSTGTLEHWNYDVFRVKWNDPFQGTDFIAFSLDPDGTVGEVRLVDGPQRYRRIAEPAAR